LPNSLAAVGSYLLSLKAAMVSPARGAVIKNITFSIPINIQ
jgi:hypothetical protein